MFIRVIKYLFLALTLSFAACEEDVQQQPVEEKRVFPGYHYLMDEIVRSPSGIFRGLNLNSTLADIKAAEPGQPVEESPGQLYYEYSADSTVNYSVAYTLEGDSIKEINVQINMNDLDMSSYLFCELKDYYANKLPNPTEDKGYVVYNCFEGQRSPFVVSLSDNSTPSKGIINMVIYKDQ